MVPGVNTRRRGVARLPPPPQAPLRDDDDSDDSVAASASVWPGLLQWRSRGVDDALVWGPDGPMCPDGDAPPAAVPPLGLPPPRLSPAVDDGPMQLPSHHHQQRQRQQQQQSSLVAVGVQVLLTACPRAKAALTHAAFSAYLSGALPLHHESDPDPSLLPARPARPERPRLVPTKQVGGWVGESIHAHW